ncbi:putative serine protease K12H4.7 [Planococcus citri]|uniref:putative serine protease K12H4.7 n=1 Tax=Planococcus citri TaxID=170843 RepID=UPI0031F7F671
MITLFLIFNVAFSSAHLINQRFKWSLDGTHSSLPAYRDLGSNEQSEFEQKLDHFDPNNKVTWKQRYWSDNSDDKKINERAILFVHGPNTLSNIDYIDTELLIPLARNLKATRFYLEHRFYGESRPKIDTSPENLVYLSSKQALEDIAYFIKNISDKHKLHKDIKWVVIGVSYGGTLATWARFKYPDLILSATAINAPLLAQADYGEYYENVVESLTKCNPKCTERITQANRELETAIKNEAGRKDVATMFNLCDALSEDPDDISSLFAELAENFARAVDFSGMKNISPKPACSLSDLCAIMSNVDTPPLTAYAEVNKKVTGILGLKCLEHRYKNRIEILKDTNFTNETKISRQWIYQTCTEFGYLKSSSKSTGIFGDHFPATFLAKRCQDLFKPEFNLPFIGEKASKVNTEFKGLEINVNNTMFIYNSEDPWRSLFIKDSKKGFYETHKIDPPACVAVNRLNAVSESGGLGGFFSEILGYVEKTMGCVLNEGNDCFEKSPK